MLAINLKMQSYILNIQKRERSSPQIMSVVKLKLLANSNQAKHTQRFHQMGDSIINTPSTIQNAKKFKSCELYKEQQQFQYLKMKAQSNVFDRVIISESKTKILTLHEIKKQDQTKRERQMAKQSLKSKSSRKIFVSLSKRGSTSKEKPKIAAQIKVSQVALASQNKKQTGQKLKLNIYKNMAKSRNS